MLIDTSGARRVRLRLTPLLFASAVLITVGCDRGSKPIEKTNSAKTESTSEQPAVAPSLRSTAPLSKYRVLPSKRSGGWAYAVTKHPPTKQELIDLGFDLRERYPATRFEIVDDVSKIDELDRAFSDPINNPFPDAWMRVHDFAMLNQFIESGGAKWKLVANSGSGYDGQVLADLESVDRGPSKRTDAPVVRFRFIPSKQTEWPVKWAYAITDMPPTTQELVNLGFALHEKYPDTRFYVCDDAHGVQAQDKNFNADPTRPFPLEWRSSHCYAMLNLMRGEVDGWAVYGLEANPSMRDKVLIRLN